MNIIINSDDPKIIEYWGNLAARIAIVEATAEIYSKVVADKHTRSTDEASSYGQAKENLLEAVKFHKSEKN